MSFHILLLLFIVEKPSVHFYDAGESLDGGKDLTNVQFSIPNSYPKKGSYLLECAP